jgi:hypothetical protein
MNANTTEPSADAEARIAERRARVAKRAAKGLDAGGAAAVIEDPEAAAAAAAERIVELEAAETGGSSAVRVVQASMRALDETKVSPDNGSSDAGGRHLHLCIGKVSSPLHCLFPTTHLSI